MDNRTFTFEKAAVDLIIKKLSDVKILRIGNYGELYFDCTHLGYNSNGVYVSIDNNSKLPYSITSRNSVILFREFPWRERRRLVKFFVAKKKEYKRAESIANKNYHRETSIASLNSMLRCFVTGK